MCPTGATLPQADMLASPFLCIGIPSYRWERDNVEDEAGERAPEETGSDATCKADNMGARAATRRQGDGRRGWHGDDPRARKTKSHHLSLRTGLTS